MSFEEKAFNTIRLEKTPDDELYFNIPEEVLDFLGWAEGDTLDIQLVSKRLSIRKIADSEGE